MAETLLLGLTHYPRLRLPDEQWNLLFLRMLNDPAVPLHMKEPAAWPEKMREEWGDDKGLSAARAQRKALMADFARMREELNHFRPDVLLIWGDDQYENFREDGISPFSVLAYEKFPVPASRLRGVKGADENYAVTFVAEKKSDESLVDIKGDKRIGKFLASELLRSGFDVTYAYKQRHSSLGHAFLNTILYLGANEQSGFPWPLLPVTVNCYGRIVVSQRGLPKGISEAPTEDLDPPSPSAARCFDLGAACARIFAASPYRVALIASSSWSHAFLTRKNYLLFPDMEADLRLYDDLMAARYASWRMRTPEQIEDSGQHEILNWACLAGALNELKLKPRFGSFHETYIFNSPKVFLAAGG